MSYDGLARPGEALKIAFIAALALESASLRRHLPRTPGWLVLQSGPGRERAARAAERAVEQGAGLLVSWGLAGGLADGLAPGSVLLPHQVVEAGGEPAPVDAAWHARIATAVGARPLEHGTLLTAPAAVESPAAKRAAAAATGAVAVDMESAGVAAAAARARVPFVVLRVVVDGVDDALPHGAERWIDGEGRTRLAAALSAAVDVRQWRGLLTLAKRYRAASASLAELARALAASDLTATGAARAPAGS